MGSDRRMVVKGLTLAIALGAFTGIASAADTLRVGKAVPFSWTFTPLDVGVEQRIFAKHGLDIQIVAFAGDAKLQQGLASASIDIGIGSGPGMGFVVKGVPTFTVAAMAGEPRNMVLVLSANSPVKSVDELKGKRIGVTTVGSLTDWLAQRVAADKGWGPNGVTTVSLGGMDSMRAAMKTGQVDASVTSIESAYALAENKEWRVLANLSSYAPHFHTHVFFARRELINNNPDAVQRYLRAWFETIAFMKSDKAKSVEITSRVLKLDKAAISRTYDEVMPMFSEDGHFDARALDVLRKSYLEMGILEKEPKDDEFLTTKFVPIRR